MFRPFALRISQNLGADELAIVLCCQKLTEAVAAAGPDNALTVRAYQLVDGTRSFSRAAAGALLVVA